MKHAQAIGNCRTAGAGIVRRLGMAGWIGLLRIGLLAGGALAGLVAVAAEPTAPSPAPGAASKSPAVPLMLAPSAVTRPPIRTLRVESLDGWTLHEDGGVRSWESTVWKVGFNWDEAVPSWNVTEGTAWTVQIRAVGTNQPTTWFQMGQWCSDTNRAPRTSWRGSVVPGGRVDTDTLHLDAPATAIQVRLSAGPGVTASNLLQFAVSVIDSKATWLDPEPTKKFWGMELKVPVRSQVDYPQGIASWCSPASLTMLINWWDGRRGRSPDAVTVPQVAAGVHDPGWPGTGNWSFNMAYAGQLPGLRGAVARLAGVADLERWIARGMPVATSVSRALLHGRPAAEEADGHLVVVRGFSESGDVVINDPGVSVDQGRKVIPRATFQKAWQRSHNTAYLVWTDQSLLPAGGQGRW